VLGLKLTNSKVFMLNYDLNERVLSYYIYSWCKDDRRMQLYCNLRVGLGAVHKLCHLSRGGEGAKIADFTQ
jgi:hypothetical protein